MPASHTSKFLGTEGGRTTHGATHGKALVNQVLQGFSYSRDAKKEAQAHINASVSQLTEDISNLCDALNAYELEHEELPVSVLSVLQGLSAELGNAATDTQSRNIKPMSHDEAWQRYCENQC